MMGKHIVILDTMLVAAGFVIRAVGGALAIQVPSSAWFVLCTFFAALFLALSKRRAEFIALSDGAGEVRSVLGEYTAATLNAYTSTAIAATTLSYALYVIDTARAFPLLPLTVPFVLFAVFRYHHLVETAGMGERPEDVFLRDRSFQVGVLAFGAAALAAVYIGA
jgi:4-hydroxybenzoate polyprenyltransferase